MAKPTNNYSPEVRERAVRMVLDGAGQYMLWGRLSFGLARLDVS